jgi:hypothetical protein
MLVPNAVPHKSIKHTAGPIFKHEREKIIRYRKGKGNG